VEKCVKYNKDDFWFDMYFGYEPPRQNNLSISDNGHYFLTMENKFGSIVREEQGELKNL
jgi:hypothetical protein